MEAEVLIAAERDLAIVQNLFPLYAHEMSEYCGWDVGPDGRYTIPAALGEYWRRSTDPGASRWPADWRGLPFLIRVGGQLAGFALVKQMGTQGFDMGEFFVLRKYRRQGVGRSAARALFERFPGRWEVRELPANMAAQEFWGKIIAGYTKGNFTQTQQPFELYGRDFVVQRFTSPG